MKIDRVIRAFSQPTVKASAVPYDLGTLNKAVDDLVRLLDVRSPARILDLACGSGDVAIGLSLRGFDVVGIDCTPAQIKRAQATAMQVQSLAEFRCQDMRLIDFCAEFDCVLLRDVIFSIFDDPHDDHTMIERMALALKPGGKCLFEVYNKAFGLQHGVERILTYDSQQDRFVPSDGDPDKLSIRLYDHDQWGELLAAHGLEIISVTGWSWRGDPLPPPWRADLILAEKSPLASAQKCSSPASAHS